MERMLSENEQGLISSFIEITAGQTTETAIQFLNATGWKLEEALQLFYIGNENGGGGGGGGGDGGQVAASTSASPLPPPVENADPAGIEKPGQNNTDEVRAPLPVVRDTLYDDAMMYRATMVGYPPRESSSVVAFRNFEEEMKRTGVWGSEQGAASAPENARENLASLYRPPFHIMFKGSFEKAKGVASIEDKWLLVNIQSNKEFSSHMLNRDTWANEAVAQTIKTNFIFWQVYDDTSDGKKVCTYYKSESLPVVLVIDPITGQKMRAWSGMVQPESLLEDLVPFMDGCPRDHHISLSHKRPRGSSQASQKNKASASETNEEDEEMQRALAASMEGIKDAEKTTSDNKDETSIEKEERSSQAKKPEYAPLPEEPKVDRSLLCRVGLRLPDGRRVQRNFLKTDPLQLLWSFCASQLGEAETRQFRLTQAIPGAKSLDYDSNTTFGESGLANSMISVAWE